MSELTPPSAGEDDLKSHPLYLHFVKWLGDNRLSDTGGHPPDVERALFAEFLDATKHLRVA